MMQILYIATSFPEPSKGSTIYTDLAEAIYEAGHEITVVVPESSVRRKTITTVLNRERGFDVLRIPVGNFYDVGLIEKGITSILMPFLIKHGIAGYLNGKQFNLILFESPPVTNTSLISWAKKKFRCKSYLMLKDIFPQNAVDLKIIKPNGLLQFYFRRKEKKLYRCSDRIGCMSTANKNYILEHNRWLSEDKVELFPNTKKISLSINKNHSNLREKYGIDEEACVFLFGGNMGRPQYIDLLCNTIVACQNVKNLFFLFVGRGTDRYKIENTIRIHQIKNARIIGNLSREEYEGIVKECDVGLLILDPRFTIPNYPSRILSYMECAKPVLAATDDTSDIKELIQEAGCGKWVWSGDQLEFLQTVKTMAEDKKLLQQMGNQGRNYLIEHFSIEVSVTQLTNYVEQVYQ